jgi:uncharacterized protein
VPPSSDTPARAHERITAIDAVRGVAVAGILFGNVLVYFGSTFAPPELLAGLPTARIDRWLTAAGRVLVEGKFYSIFSLLFGVGFGLQLERRGDSIVGLFRRRLRMLALIGAAHAFLIWAGDILLLYALLGFTMPWFARRSDAALLRWSVGLLAIPTATYIAALGLWTLLGPAPGPANAPPGLPPEILDRLAAMGTGGLLDMLIGNLIFFVGRWADLIATMRFPKVLGMFVLGLWLVRRGVAKNPGQWRNQLRRWMLLGFAVGLPANVLAAWAFANWPYLSPSAGGFLGVIGQALGVPMLAIGFACTIAQASGAGRRWAGVFVPVGRMALTNYLTHSVVCVLLSYGIGLGLWWRVGTLHAWAIAVAIIAVQIPVSRWWLARYRFGPMEWLWRRMTYRQPLPMRIQSAPATA